MDWRDQQRRSPSGSADYVIGQRLIACRIEKAIPAEQLASTMGMTMEDYTGAEKGRYRLSAVQLMFAAKLLGVRMATFYDGL